MYRKRWYFIGPYSAPADVVSASAHPRAAGAVAVAVGVAAAVAAAGVYRELWPLLRCEFL